MNNKIVWLPLSRGRVAAAPPSATRLFLFKIQQVNINIRVPASQLETPVPIQEDYSGKATKHVY